MLSGQWCDWLRYCRSQTTPAAVDHHKLRLPCGNPTPVRPAGWDGNASDFGATLQIALTTNLLSSKSVRGLVLSDGNRMAPCRAARSGRGPDSRHMRSVSFTVRSEGDGLMCCGVRVGSHRSQWWHCVFLLHNGKQSGLDVKFLFALCDVTLWAKPQSCFCPLKPPSGCLVFVPFPTWEKLKKVNVGGS